MAFVMRMTHKERLYQMSSIFIFLFPPLLHEYVDRLYCTEYCVVLVVVQDLEDPQVQATVITSVVQPAVRAVHTPLRPPAISTTLAVSRRSVRVEAV